MARKKTMTASKNSGNTEAVVGANTTPKRKPGRPKGSKNKPPAKGSGGKRGRKAIFSDEQKKVLDRMIKTSLKAELRALVRAL